jgi:uncharacterized protein (TIRG00374 family)
MKLKLWLNVITFAAIAVIIFFAWHDIVAAFEKMLTLNLWILALIVPMQIFGFYAVAKVYSHYFKIIGQPIAQRTLTAAAIELNFVNHIFPSGGVSGFSYLALRLKQQGVSTAKSTLAQLVRFMAAFVTFIGLLVLALFLLALEDKASRFIIFVATALTFTIIFLTLSTIYIIGSEDRIQAFTRSLGNLINKLIHIFRPKHPETLGLQRIEQTFRELHEDYVLLRGDVRKLKGIVVWATIANIVEIIQIYVVFVAHGTFVNPGAIIIAYAVATLAGLIAILPGGLGVYEPLMAAILLSAGVEADIALSVTLVSRVITLAVALSLGYVLYHRVVNHYARNSSERQ